MKGLKVNRFGTGFKTASYNHPFIVLLDLKVKKYAITRSEQICCD